MSKKSIAFWISTLLLSLLLAGCETVGGVLDVWSDMLKPEPDSRPEVFSESVLQAEMARLDFKFASGIAHDRTNDQYILVMTSKSVVSALGNHNYNLVMGFFWDPRSGRREGVPLSTRFYYDGRDLIFFNDRNKNNKLDATEYSERHDVSARLESGEFDVSLKAEVIDNSPWYDLDLRLVFDSAP